MTSEMEKDILKVLVSEEELKKRVQELGAQLHEKYQGHRPLFLGVLKGSFIFMADLVRATQIMCDIEFMSVSSYQNGTVSSGRVQIRHDLQQDAVLLAGDLIGELISGDLHHHVPGLYSVSLVLDPLGDGSLLHGQAQLGHQYFISHLTRLLTCSARA
mgnify:FL=1